MTDETGGGGDAPANDNVELPEAANDNTAADGDDGGAGGGEPNEGAGEETQDPLEPANDNVATPEADDGDAREDREEDEDSEHGGRGDRDEAEEDAEAPERLGVYLRGLVTAISLSIGMAMNTLDVQINLYENQLAQVEQTRPHPGPGDPPVMYGVSPEERKVQAKLEKARSLHEELERTQKILEAGDAEDSPEKPEPSEGQIPPVAALVLRPPRVANDNDPPGQRPK